MNECKNYTCYENLYQKKRLVNKIYVILHCIYSVVFIITLMSLIALVLINNTPLIVLFIGTIISCIIMMILNITTEAWYNKFWDISSKYENEDIK